MKRSILIPINDEDETERRNLFGHATHYGWSVHGLEEPWQHMMVEWMTRLIRQDGRACELLNAVKFNEGDKPPIKVELEGITVADLASNMARKFLDMDKADEMDCEMKFKDVRTPMGMFPIAPSWTSPTTFTDVISTRYDIAGGSPVFVVADEWAIPCPLFFEHQFTIQSNNRPRLNAWDNGDGKQILDLGWMEKHPKRPLALIAIPSSPELVGKVVILETDEFHFVGCRGDPVRRGENAGKPLIRPDISFNPFQAIPNMIDRPNQSQNWLEVDVSELARMAVHNGNDAHIFGGKEHGLRNDPHRFLCQTAYYASLIEFCVESAVARSVAVKDMDGAHVVQAGEAVPSWRDKRGVKVFDRATPRYAVFHDEIRCPSCNGRHLIKLPSGNTISECKCLHEPCEQVIQFPHLVSRKHENGGTADGER